MTFVRIPGEPGKWHEVPGASAHDEKWIPQPIDSRASWGSWDFALTSFADGMNGGLELDLIFHLKGDPVWSSVGASDGVVYGSGLTYEQATNDGFLMFWYPVQAEIQGRLKAVCESLDHAKPPLQIAVNHTAPKPVTFPTFQSWLHENVSWIGGAAPPGPTPIPTALFPLYMGRAFAGGYGFDFGIEADGSPACRVNTPTGWKKFVLPS